MAKGNWYECGQHWSLLLTATAAQDVLAKPRERIDKQSKLDNELEGEEDEDETEEGAVE